MNSVPNSSTVPVLERWFGLSARGTTVQREVMGGLATFMTMAYIIFVNPLILSSCGMPIPAVVAATCIGAAIPTLIIGVWANYPLALASGMGLNAAVAMHATQPGMTWQKMMGVIVVEGVLITLLVLTGAREKVMDLIPMNLKRAIGVGIGLFIAFLGLQEMGWVVKGPGPVFATHGEFTSRPVVVASLGLMLIFFLMVRRVSGAILLGILGTTIIAAISDMCGAHGAALVSLPKQWLAVPDFSVFGQADIVGALKPSLFGLIFAFLITDFFDTMGSVIGVGGQAGFLDSQGRLPRLWRVLMVDSLAAAWGGLCGASSVTTYIESAAGVSQGGRTGLVCVVVALLFVVSLFLAPIIGMVPSVATAPALVVVGFLMMSVMREMELTNPEEGLPAFLTLLAIPLGQSISFGVGLGFISHVLVKLFLGKAREVSLWLYVIAALFVASFIWGL